MNKRVSLGTALTMLLIVAAVTFSITMMYARSDFNTRVTDLRESEAMYEKFADLDRLIRPNYIGTINETQLMDSVARGYIEGVGDKYGRYITAEEYKKLTPDEESENVGIGAVIAIAPDDFYLVVNEVYPDSPAAFAGMEAGDLIVQIDDTELTRENSRQQLDAIMGPPGSKIALVTRRGSTENRVEMARLAVTVPTVLYSRLLEDSTVGYMHIKEFGDRTYDQFNRELLNLMDAGATSLVFDLRNNAGGVLKSTTRILDKLLPQGVLVSATYKNGTTETLYTSDDNQINLPMVVLTNAGTASEAELFAQSIKDFEKGSIVGAVTTGKGVMQELLKLPDGSAVELTVAYYKPKSGFDFDGVGIKPDFEVPMEDDWHNYLEVEGSDVQLVKAKEVAIALEKSTAQAGEPAAEDSDASAESSDTPASSSAASTASSAPSSLPENSGE